MDSLYDPDPDGWKYDDEEWDDWFGKYGYKDVENYEDFLPPASQILKRVRRQAAAVAKDFDPKEVLQAYRENITPCMLTACIIFWLTCIVLPLLFCAEYLYYRKDRQRVSPEEHKENVHGDEIPQAEEKDEEQEEPKNVEYITEFHQATQVAYKDGEDIYQDIRPRDQVLIVTTHHKRYSRDEEPYGSYNKFLIHQRPVKASQEPDNSTGTDIRKVKSSKSQKQKVKSDPSKSYAKVQGKVVRRKPDKTDSVLSHVATQTSKENIPKEAVPAESTNEIQQDDKVWNMDLDQREEVPEVPTDADPIPEVSTINETKSPSEDNAPCEDSKLMQSRSLAALNNEMVHCQEEKVPMQPPRSSRDDRSFLKCLESQKDAPAASSTKPSKSPCHPGSSSQPPTRSKDCQPSSSSTRERKKCEGKVLVGKSSRFVSAESKAPQSRKSTDEADPCSCPKGYVTKQFKDLNWYQVLEYIQADGGWYVNEEEEEARRNRENEENNAKDEQNKKDDCNKRKSK